MWFCRIQSHWGIFSDMSRKAWISQNKLKISVMFIGNPTFQGNRWTREAYIPKYPFNKSIDVSCPLSDFGMVMQRGKISTGDRTDIVTSYQEATHTLCSQSYFVVQAQYDVLRLPTIFPNHLDNFRHLDIPFYFYGTNYVFPAGSIQSEQAVKRKLHKARRLQSNFLAMSNLTTLRLTVITGNLMK